MQTVNALHLKRKLHTMPLVIRVYSVILAALVLFGACKKEPDAPKFFPLEGGELSASATSVVIDSGNPSGEALKLSWSAFPSSKIGFSIIFSAGSVSDTVSVSSSSKTFTMGELNTILVKKLGLAIGVPQDISAVLQSKVTDNEQAAASNTVTLNVTPGPVGAAYSKLWIVGAATPNEWDINNPNEMKPDPADPFQFKYNEILKAGEFKIPTTTGNWSTDFFMPPSNHPDLSSTEVVLIPGGSPDNKWDITTPGAYKIVLNIGPNPFIQIKPFTPYPNLWLVGDATPAGWNIDSPTPMVATVGNPYEFTYTGTLNAGEFKIPTAAGNWNSDFFMPPVNGTGASGKDAVLIPSGNPDNKWKITEAGNYRIKINQLYETISIEKLN